MADELLTQREKQRWVWFHTNSYKENLKLAEKLLITSPRWSIIIGYYAMHDVTKLYLGKVHGLKIVGQNVHAQTIEKLRQLIVEDKEKVVELLNSAEDQMKIAIRMGEKFLPHMLRHGKAERGKSQYYQVGEDNLFKTTYSVKASQFVDEIVKPYIKIFEALC